MIYPLPPSVLLCSVHSKVYPAVCSLHKNQEEVFNKRCHLLRGKLTTQFLSLSNDFQGEYHKTVKELNKLDSIESPLDGLYTFQDALVSVTLPTPPTHSYHPHSHCCIPPHRIRLWKTLETTLEQVSDSEVSTENYPMTQYEGVCSLFLCRPSSSGFR